ncbi:MAG: metallophosphoesterase [Cyanobacteria bacterium J06642_11]
MRPLFSGPLTVEAITIPIRELPAQLEGKVIVQLSDLHYDDGYLSDRMLEQAIATIPTLNPDLVVFTGDFVTTLPEPIHQLVPQLKPIAQAYPTLAILGNHDHWSPETEPVLVESFSRIDITVLRNQIAYPFGPALPVVGLVDYYHPDFSLDILQQLSPDVPRIVLSHNPDTAELMMPWRVDLQLSGHTHGGQIVIPGFGNLAQRWFSFRAHLPRFIRQSKIPYVSDRCASVFIHWEWAMGLHTVGKNKLYVNRGLGTYAPGRLFCNPEITAITLTRQLA